MLRAVRTPTLLARVRRTLRERALIERGQRVLVACSGGPDSAALLVVLAQLSRSLDITLEAASVDHGLRADASADVALAAAQAAALGVPFHALTVKVRRAPSLQAAARGARYAALLTLARKLGAARVAVGHTRDDQAETVLLRLLRGASVLGLSGIAPRRQDGVIRPLIDCDRAAVAAFAAAHHVSLARDPSNADERFARVRLRTRVMPALLAENPNLVAQLCDLADDGRALLDALRPRAEALLAASAQDTEIMDISSWGAEPEPVRRLALRAWLRPLLGRDLLRAHIAQLDRALLGHGEVWLPSGFAVVARGDGLLRLVHGRAVHRQRGVRAPAPVRSRRKKA